MKPHRLLFVYYGTRGLAGAYIDGFARALSIHGEVEPYFAVSNAYRFPPRRGRLWRMFFPITERRWVSRGLLRLAVRYVELCIAYAALVVLCVVRRIDTVNLSLIDDYFSTWAFASVVTLLGRQLHVVAHDSMSYADGSDRWRRRTFARANRILVHYQHVADDLVRHFSVESGRITVLPFPSADPRELLDERALTRAGEQIDRLTAPERPVVLFVGIVRRQKGVAVLVDAWRGLRWTSPGAPPLLVIAGKGDAIADLPSDQSILRVAKYLDDEDFAAWLHRASLVVFPYAEPRYAHSATILLAALAARPVVVTDIPLFGYLAKPLRAFVARAGSSESLARVLEEALSQPAQELVERGRAAADAVTTAIEDLTGTLGSPYVRAVLEDAVHS